MQKLRTFRNTSLKKALMNKNIYKTKSANWKNKSFEEPKNKIYSKNNNINIIQKDNKEISNFDTLDLDLNLKNEKELAEKIYKANQLKIKENQIEDEEINSLNDKIRKIMLKNFEIQTNIQKQLNMRYFYEKNQKSIASYINDLNYKFRNYDETINKNETCIKKMKKENKILQNEYDKKIEQIENENEKLKKRIKDRIELYMHQKGQIDEKSAKTQNLEKEISIQKNTIKERVRINKKKVDELENKYQKMYKKLIDIEVNCEDKKIKNMFEENLYTIEESKKMESEYDNEKGKNYKQIKDRNKSIGDRINDDELFFELKQLNKQYDELTKSHDSRDNKKPRYTENSTMKTTVSNFIRDIPGENKNK